jgi:cytoskeleton protein RodZ
MKSVASELKLQREKLNLPLSQIAEDTRISLRYLESLEAGRYSDLPGGMYNRAFIRAYCEKLGIDQNEIIRRYEEEISPLTEKLPKSKVHIPSQSQSRRTKPILIWSAILLILAVVLLTNIKWFTTVFSPYFHARGSSIQFEPPAQPEATRPDPAAQPSSPPLGQPPPATLSMTSAPPDQLHPIPSQNLNQTPANASSGNWGASPSTEKLPLQLELLGTEKCWLSIYRDGIQALRKEIEPGESLSFGATEKFFIIAGNAGGIRLKINGKSLKSIGQSGEVRRLLIDEKTLPDLLDPNAG